MFLVALPFSLALIIMMMVNGPSRQWIFNYIQTYLNLGVVAVCNMTQGAGNIPAWARRRQAGARLFLRRVGWAIIGTALILPLLMIFLILSIYAETHNITAFLCGILVVIGFIILKPWQMVYKQFGKGAAFGASWIVIGPATLCAMAIGAPGLLGPTGQVIILILVCFALVWEIVGDLAGWKKTAAPQICALVLIGLIILSKFVSAMPWAENQNLRASSAMATAVSDWATLMQWNLTAKIDPEGGQIIAEADHSMGKTIGNGIAKYYEERSKAIAEKCAKEHRALNADEVKELRDLKIQKDNAAQPITSPTAAPASTPAPAASTPVAVINTPSSTPAPAVIVPATVSQTVTAGVPCTSSHKTMADGSTQVTYCGGQYKIPVPENSQVTVECLDPLDGHFHPMANHKPLFTQPVWGVSKEKLSPPTWHQGEFPEPALRVQAVYLKSSQGTQDYDPSRSVLFLQTGKGETSITMACNNPQVFRYAGYFTFKVTATTK